MFAAADQSPLRRRSILRYSRRPLLFVEGRMATTLRYVGKVSHGVSIFRFFFSLLSLHNTLRIMRRTPYADAYALPPHINIITTMFFARMPLIRLMFEDAIMSARHCSVIIFVIRFIVYMPLRC